MTAPRIEVDLKKIRHNTRSLHSRLKARGIGITGVTKAVCGHPAIAKAMLDGGAAALADARAVNVDRMRAAGINCQIYMIRTPMQSQAAQIVQTCNTSYNTQMGVIAEIAAAALQAQSAHNVILMVEMGDGREGIMPDQLNSAALQVHHMPGIVLTGIGANFACLSGIAPTQCALARLSAMASAVEDVCDTTLKTVSGGNSASLPLLLDMSNPLSQAGRINDVRLGEAILLGVDPVSGRKIDGLFTDAFKLFAEVIEAKPGLAHPPILDPVLPFETLLPKHIASTRFILALGQQDTDLSGLTPPRGVSFLGSTSDHMVVATQDPTMRVGSEVSFQLNYSAIMRAMSAPDVLTVVND